MTSFERREGFENQVLQLLQDDPWLKEKGIEISTELHSSLQPFDAVLSWTCSNQVRHDLVIEVDGSFHVYSLKDPIMNQMTDFKYRLFDLYSIPYLRISYEQHTKEYRSHRETDNDSKNKGVIINQDSIIEAVQKRIIDIEQ